MTTATPSKIQILTHCAIFDGEAIHHNKALVIDGQNIHGVYAENKLPEGSKANDCSVIDCQGQLITAGFIDTQVNGASNTLFNDSPTVESIRIIASYHRRYGTTGLLPTLISPSRALIGKALLATTSAAKNTTSGCLGIHIEGPFLNKEKRGVHPEEQILNFTSHDLALLSQLPNQTLVTIAPEALTPEQITTLTKAGVIISLGHSNANFETTITALNSGASGFTHLFNAMSPLTSREPNMVGAALADENSWCGIIVDGYHVHPCSLKIAIKSKPQGKVFLVTDAIHAVGSDKHELNLLGQTIINSKGKVCTPEGTLAGSGLTMIEAVKNTISMLDMSLEESLRMASLYPAQFLGMDNQLGRIKSGYQASLIALDDDLNVTKSWVNGDYLSH